MSADTTPPQPADKSGLRRRFRTWRGERPFWAGLWTMLAGVPIMYIPYQTLKFGELSIRLSTTAGAGSLIIGILLIVLGLTMWFQRHSRVFSGIAAILLGIVSLVVSNFGAFLLGIIPAMLGGALAVSWAPAQPLPEATDASEEEPPDLPIPSGPSLVKE
ncbi:MULTISPECIES: DUF6114 domain-containing protein [Streptomyces]|uniref:DUF6114 domain-containing protein n=1 Tax=Streptomyces TaxID=1883 RepID=UPI00163B7FE2|nr:MULTISPECIES: DUF6114 domain-containing protein [Streptomyces]MBC2874480.1 hypothetical protein [Streptomyces sp. TYQ1024]UBI36745.1 DUF6114 domain-containing protein [Streptomyces mobaraensis]UKW29337.1 DUF6114 domain-containing protein [Streptomyces sp. TYQ1024]